MAWLQVLAGHPSADSGVTSPAALPRVIHSDLNLDGDRSEGIAAPYTRPRAAASRVCAPLQSRAMLLPGILQPCIADATPRTAMIVSNPALTTYSIAGGGLGQSALAAGQP